MPSFTGAYLWACEVLQLLHHQPVVVMGNSVQRAVHKDLLPGQQAHYLPSSRRLKAKGDLRFE